AASVVEELGDQTENIHQIVGIIREIADNTNLLALNAAVEAANAGEHGRGFAVVANEVRKLARQSAASAEQIAQLLHQIQDNTRNAILAMRKGSHVVKSGTLAMANAGVAFEKILSAAESVSEQIQEISAASEELSAGSEKVAASIA